LACTHTSSGAGDGSTYETLFLDGPTGEFRGFKLTGPATSSQSAILVEQATPDPNTYFADIGASADAAYEETVVVYHSSKRVITLTLDGSANPATNTCALYGTAVAAPN